MNLAESIKSRKSVRSFSGKPLRPEDREKIEEFLSGIENPFDVPVRFVLLDAREQGLSSPVITGETLYAAGIAKKGPSMEAAYGYCFEQLVLYAWSLGIGTTWIGGTMKRELFEKAAGLQNGERMPCISPLGYPAEKRSLRETMMRRGAGSDTRLPLERLFFDGDLETPLSGEKLERIRDVGELVRWAPSAVNRQPWRIVLTDTAAHFYEKKDKGYVSEAVGDMQKIDVGIALCHYVLGMRSLGKPAAVTLQDPGIAPGEKMEYIASVQTE